MNNIKNLLWQEKYRPINVKDVISPFINQILKALENPMAIQNFIFYSRIGGTGKTSLSKAIVNDLNCDVLNLNSSDERSIDTIRHKVKDFMVSQSSNPNCKKCIIMDEGEKLTRDAADALKNTMEEYSSNCFIILTTNNLQKIPEPLQTRFKIFEFIQPDKQEIYKYIKNICEIEKIKYDEEGINKLIDIHYPSIRKMVNHLQDLNNQELPLMSQNIIKQNSLYDNIWRLIKKEDYQNTKKIILTQGINVEELNKYIFDIVISGDIELKKELKILPILAKTERDLRLGADKNIAFISSIADIIRALRG